MNRTSKNSGIVCRFLRLVRFIAPYAQKSSTVSNLEMSRRFACHVLLLSFLKNHRDHLLGKKKIFAQMKADLI